MRPLLLVMLVACSPAPVAPPAPPPSAPASTRAPDVPRLTDKEEGCLLLQRAFQARLDVATGACTTDRDCGCYAGVAPGLGCGGATDFDASIALASLATQFTGAGCVMPERCVEKPCVADCIDNRCVRRIQPY